MSDQYILSETIVFDQKPVAVPYNYRISYRVALLLMIIKYCCSSRSGCSLIKINMISNILAKRDTFNEINVLRNSSRIVRFDPAVTRGLNFAIAEGLMEQQKDGKFRLTADGKKYVEEICKQDDLMRLEKEMLNKISTSITEEKIQEIMSDWSYGYVKN